MREKILRQNANYTAKVEALCQELAQHTEAALNGRPHPGAWSALQVCRHLIEAEALSLAYVRKRIQKTDDLPDAGLKTLRARLILWFYLNTPIKFKAPAVVADEKLPEYGTLSETQALWLQARNEWSEFLEQLPEALLVKATYRHPIVGRLSWSGSIAFFEAHFVRHRKQIRRTLRAVNDQ